MSIAALMVDLDDLPSYTQEDDGVYNRHASAIERVSLDIDILSQSTTSLVDVYLTLESIEKLCPQSNRYMGLALDAAMGKERSLMVDERVYNTRGIELTLEATTDDKKVGVLAKIWAFIKAQYEKVVTFFTNTFGYAAKLKADKKKKDALLSAAIDALPKYIPSKEDFVISEKQWNVVGALVGGSHRSIPHVLSRLTELTRGITMGSGRVLTATMELVDSTNYGAVEKATVKLGHAQIKLKNDIELGTHELPGTMTLGSSRLHDTAFGRIAKHIDSDKRLKNQWVPAKLYSGDPKYTEGGTTLKGTPDRRDLEVTVGYIKSIGDDIDSMIKIIESRDWVRMTKLKPEKEPRLDSDDQTVNDNLLLAHRVKAAAVADPSLRLVSDVLRYAYDVYSVNISILTAMIKAGDVE